MKTVFYSSDSRGFAKTDWLKSYHTFSFAEYHNPERMNFGLMRVLNDDYIKPSTGFGSHSHQNMEIITILLQGSLFHQDHLGNKSTIKKGEVQIMSAGTGIIHSEQNPSSTEEVNLFQIWIFPDKKQILPRYGQKAFLESNRANKFQCVVSPDEREGSLWINQDAFIYLSKMDKGSTLEYTLQNPKHCVYLMLIDGKAQAAKESLNKRDAIGIVETEKFSITASENTELVIFELPTA